MDADLAALPDDIEALKAALLVARAEAAQAQDVAARAQAEAARAQAEAAEAKARVSDDQALIAHLRQHGIMAVFHYQPLHLSEMGRRLGGGGAPEQKKAAPDRGAAEGNLARVYFNSRILMFRYQQSS